MPTPPSPLVAALLSGLLPGAGHWYAGYRRRGRWLMAITFVAVLPVTVLGALVLFVTGPHLALEVSRPFFDHPNYLLMLLAINAVVLVFRVAAGVDAFLLAGGRIGAFRPMATALLAVALVILAALPHIWVGQRNLALYDLFTHDFSVDPGQAAGTTIAAPPPPSTTTTVATTTTSNDPASSTTSTTTTTTTTTIPPTTTTTLPPLEDRRVNVLVMGGDAGPDRTGIRTDSMIVASIDPVTGDTAMFGVPRNIKMMPFPEGHPAYDLDDCHCWTDLINALYQFGLANPDLFPGGPNSGANAITTVLSHVLGIDIHHYVLVDLQGFVQVIDALGGLTITVTEYVIDEFYTRPGGEVVPVNYSPGVYEMDGEEALAYARVRRNSNDYFRMGRQRCVLQAIAEQTDTVDVMRRLPKLVPAVQDAVLTDIPVADWPDFIELAAAIDTETIVSVRFMPRAPELEGTGLSYTAGYTETRHPIANVDLIRQTVRRIITTDPATAAADIGVDPLGEVCE